jgi:hypothetical protein
MLASIVTPITDTFRIHISGEEELEVVLENGNLRIVGDSGVVVWDQSRWRMRMKRRSMAMRIQRFWRIRRIRIQDKMATRIQSHWKMGVARKKMQEMKDPIPQVHLTEDSTELKEIGYKGQLYLLNTATKDVVDADDGEKVGIATLDEGGEVMKIEFEGEDDSDDSEDDSEDDSGDDGDEEEREDVPHHEVNTIADHTVQGEVLGSLSEFTITQSVEKRKSKNLTPHGLKRGSRNGNLPGSFWISRSGRVLRNGANVSTGDQSWGAGMLTNDYCPTARIIGTHEGKKHGVCQCDRINFI